MGVRQAAKGKGGVLGAVLCAVSLSLSGCGSTGILSATALTRSAALRAIRPYVSAHNGLPKCSGQLACYGVIQTLGDLAVFETDLGGTGGDGQTTVFLVHGSKVVPVWSQAGFIALSEVSGLIDGASGLVVLDNAVGDNGLYSGQFAAGICGECPETIVRVYDQAAANAPSAASFEQSLLWASPVIAGTVQPIPLSAQGRWGLLIRNYYVTNNDLNSNGDLAPGVFADYIAVDPGHVWQWDSALHRMVVVQAGLDVNGFGTYGGEHGVELSQAGYITGPEVSGGFASTPPQNEMLQPGSVVSRVDGHTVTSMSSFQLLIERTPVDGTIALSGNYDTAPFSVAVKAVPFPAGWSSVFFTIQMTQNGSTPLNTEY